MLYGKCNGLDFVISRLKWTNSVIARLNCLIAERCASKFHREFLALSWRLSNTQLTRLSNLRNASVNNLSVVVDNYVALSLLSMDAFRIASVYAHETETIEGWRDT